MKYATVVLAAAAGVAFAQSPADYFPECALDCLDAAVESSTTCSLDDAACQCTDENQTAIQGGATSCVISACGSDVAINEVLPAAAEFCAAVNSGAGATTTAEETTAEETTPVETTSAEETTPAETTTAEETTAEETTAAETTTMETATSSATGNTTAPTSTTPVEVSGAGVAATYGGFLGLVLAALAAF